MYEATKNGALLVAAFFIMAVLNYAFGVTLSWFFGPAEYGVVGVAQSLLLLTALVVGSGFAWTAAHDVAELGLGDESRRRFRAAWVANTGLGLLLAGALWAAYVFGWLPLGPAYRLVVPLVGLTTVILAARAVVNGALRGLYRFGPLGLNQVGEVIIKSMAGLALVAAGAGAEGVMIGFALGSAAALLHSLWVVGSSRLWRGPGWLDGNVVAATVPLFAGMMGPALMLYLDVLGLKLLAPAALGDELAGFYQAAVILARTPVFMAQALTAALFSYVAGSAREGTTPASYMQAALRAWARVLLPAALVLALAPGAALDLFFPPAYQVASAALRAAAVGAALLALVTLMGGVAQAAGQRRAPAIASAVALAAQLAVLVWSVPRWGTLGAALSLVAAGVVALALLAPVAILPFLRGETAQAFIPGLLQAAIPLAALAVPLLLLPDGGRAAAFVKLAVGSLAYVLALLGVRRPWVREVRARATPPTGQRLVRFMHILIAG